MNEARRMHYLEAMGIDMFVPRFRLPNTLASVQCELPVASADERSIEPVQTSSFVAPALVADTCIIESVSSGLAGVLSALDLDSSPSKRQPKVLEESAPATQTDSDDVPSTADSKQESAQDIQSLLSKTGLAASAKCAFSLGLWLTDQNIQVIDSRQVGDALPTEALLNNILQFHSLVQNGLPRIEVQDWPVPGLADADQSWRAAQEMINEFLLFRFEERACLGFILFGKDALHAAVSDHINFDDVCFSVLSEPLHAAPVLVLPALRDLLYAPENKREVYQAMSAFEQARALLNQSLSN